LRHKQGPRSKGEALPPVLKTNKPPIPKKESATVKPTARIPQTSKRPTTNKCVAKNQKAPRYPPVRTTRAQAQKHAEQKLAELNKLADEQKTLLAEQKLDEEKQKLVDQSIVEEDSIEEINYELSQQVELLLVGHHSINLLACYTTYMVIFVSASSTIVGSLSIIATVKDTENSERC
jgi:hypothetical protein